jgi:hypothetical protein
LISEHVSVSTDGLKTNYTGASKENCLCGVVFGDGIIPSFAEGQYFEVRVEETEAGKQDGLAIGITTMEPESTVDTYEVAVDVPHSWSLGYDGGAQIAGEEDMRNISWQPKSLSKGDCVGFLVRSDALVVYENGQQVEVLLCGNCPAGRPLYPFIDLLGGTNAVSLILGASPPKSKGNWFGGWFGGGGAAAVPSVPLQQCQFNRVLISEHVTVSADGLKASYTGADKENSMRGVVFGDSPIPNFPTGSYFEVRVEEVASGAQDGLALGVTTKYPGEVFEVAQEVPDSWSFGYDGSAQLNDEDDMRTISWHPQNLKKADRVGFSVRGAAVSVYLNDKKVVSMACTIPEGRPLYPIVDLLGCTNAVSLLPAASPPDDLPLLRFNDNILANAAVSNALASYTAVDRDEMGGTVFGDGPVPIFPQGRYFEVKIEDTEVEAAVDGLAIGVTLFNPQCFKEPFDIAEEVPRSWSFGYDGQAHVDGKEEMVEIPWKPNQLKKGDRVSLLVAHDGAAHVYVNDIEVTSMKCDIPVDLDMYPIVDLLGVVRAVSLLPEAKPPGTDLFR